MERRYESAPAGSTTGADVTAQSAALPAQSILTRFERFPERMRAKRRWIGWIWGSKDPSGRWLRYDRAELVAHEGHLWYVDANGVMTRVSKLPKNVRTLRPASVDDPTTWASLGEVCDSIHRGDVDGAGYVLDENEVLLDVDGCIKNGEPSAFARMCIAELDSYTERSVSGEGIHIIVVANGFIPDRGQKGARCEVYVGGRTNRFSTVSGDVLDGCDELNEDAEDVLTGIYQSEFEDMPVISTQDASEAYENLREMRDFELTADDARAVAWMCGHYKWGRPMFEKGDFTGWAADRRRYQPNKDCSQSEADFALAGYLFAATNGDPERTLVLFNSSAMWRPKFDEIHDGHNLYSVMTVGKIYNRAREGVMDAETMRRRAIERRDERLAKYPPRLRHLAGLMRADDVTDSMLRRVMAYHASGAAQRDLRQPVEEYPEAIVGWIVERWARVAELAYRFELEGVRR